VKNRSNRTANHHDIKFGCVECDERFYSERNRNRNIERDKSGNISRLRNERNLEMKRI
jgi:hypothetical protein